VGAVFCIEASRLARNGRDWHHLIELCGMTGVCRFSRKWRAGVFCKLVFPPFGRGFSRHRGLPIRCGLEGA
jgi:hypothetical protein